MRQNTLICITRDSCKSDKSSGNQTEWKVPKAEGNVEKKYPTRSDGKGFRYLGS